MVETSNPLNTLRARLSESDPNWQERIRAELEFLVPGWESFPILFWDDETADWKTIVLLANPEKVSPPPEKSSLIRRFFKRMW